MKIIDLLNKIANGEEVPNKIKWEDIIFAYSDYDKDYLEFPFSTEEYQGLFCMKDSILTQFLNDTVEILEEEKKIPEKLDEKAKDKMKKLQEENEKLKEKLEDETLNKEIAQGHRKQVQDIELQERKELKDYKSRNEKAIEYIKENICDIDFMKKEYGNHFKDYDIETTFKDIENLLNILGGDDNE